MKTLYLCGAINGCSDAECKDWREFVKKELDGFFAILDPMRRDFRGKEDTAVNEIVQGDYDDIAVSQVLLVAADKPSWGTAMEMHQAFINGKTVIVVCGQARISPWLRYHSTKLFVTLEEAVAFLKGE